MEFKKLWLLIMSSDEDLVASIIKNDLKQVIINTHSQMLKKFPKQKKMLDTMLKMRLENLEKHK